MIENPNFLCEIGCEEIPAGYIPPAIDAVKRIFTQKLKDNLITFNDLEVFATPRRLVVVISELAQSQREETAEIKGPSVKAAYDDKGKPTRALEGFLNSNGLSLNDVYTKDAGKGEYIFAVKKTIAQNTEEIIPDILKHLILNLPFPKRMKWSDKDITFPRPISYFLLLLNGKIIPFQLSGIEASNFTKGHFIQANNKIEITNIKNYENLLEKNQVILDQNKRKEIIRQQLLDSASKLNKALIEDEDLIDTVNFLVENPHVVECQFNKDFLKIPDVVLITEMREHQKYFALREKSGILSNNFLVISNNPPTEKIRSGYERVLHARFNDASFFLKEDQKSKLEEKVKYLKNVLFHKELGTVYDKIQRMIFIADFISKSLNLDDETIRKINRAILLCKGDLTTTMVGEFPSLQGIIGRIYALADGEDNDISDAIDYHYKPRFRGDILPENIISIVVSISEKLDNISGAFSVGNIPKGSQDPYALRRQANAIVEILIKNSINLDIKDVAEHSSSQYKEGKELIGPILEFITARAKTILIERNFRHDEIDACLSAKNYDFFEIFKRAQSINEFRKDLSFKEMLLSFKRMNNIVSAFMQKNPGYDVKFDKTYLSEEPEKQLFDFFDARNKEINEFITSGKYQKLFSLLIIGKPIVDNFFDKVLVMADDIKIRDNRLALLKSILSNFKNLLDFSKISE